MRDAWDPDRYDRFRDERRQPFFDLLALVRRRPGMRVLDLGCGTGELTALLHRRLRARATLGIDSSPAMLDRARRRARGRLAFAPGDAAAVERVPGVETGAWDLVFSNAALHWVPGHPALLERLAALLAPGGQLALQLPANHRHPSQTVAVEVAREPRFATALGGWARQSPVLEPEEYAELLARLGMREQQVRLQVYTHPLPGPEEVIDWVAGTTLTDYERRLPPERYAAFLARYRELLLARLPAGRPYRFHFRRILVWGRR